MHSTLILILLLCAGSTFLQETSDLERDAHKTLVYQENFSSEKSFWVEGKGSVSLKDHRLYQNANTPDRKQEVCSTVWLRQPLPNNFEIHIQACVLASDIHANNINLFFCYKDPSGAPLEQTSSERVSGKYSLYHQLEGYIFTYIHEVPKDEKTPSNPDDARLRLRRCPGFQMIAESREGRSVVGETHDIILRKNGGLIQAWVDGQKQLEATDPTPLNGGLLGLRTFCTSLWWSDLKVYELKD